MSIYKSIQLVDKYSWYKVSITFVDENVLGILKIYNEDDSVQQIPAVHFPNKFLKNTEYVVFIFVSNVSKLNFYGLNLSIVKIILSKQERVDQNSLLNINDIEFSLYYMKIFSKTGTLYNKLTDKLNLMKNEEYFNNFINNKIQVKKIKTDKVNIAIFLDNLNSTSVNSLRWLSILRLVQRSSSLYNFFILSDKKTQIDDINYLKFSVPDDSILTSKMKGVTENLVKIIQENNIDIVLTNDIYHGISTLLIDEFPLIYVEDVINNVDDTVENKFRKIVYEKSNVVVVRQQNVGENVNKLYIPYSIDPIWLSKQYFTKNVKGKTRVGYIGYDTQNNVGNIQSLLKMLSGHGYLINLILQENILGRQFDSYKKNNTIMVNVCQNYKDVLKCASAVDVIVYMQNYNYLNIMNTIGLEKLIICDSTFNFNDGVCKYFDIGEIPKIIKNNLGKEIKCNIISDTGVVGEYVNLFGLI